MSAKKLKIFTRRRVIFAASGVLLAILAASFFCLNPNIDLNSPDTINQENKETNVLDIKTDSQNARSYSLDGWDDKNFANKEIIGFIGDSITFGDPFPHSNAVQSMIKTLGNKYLYINDGINGQTTDSYKNVFLPLALNNFQAFKIKNVCIMLGTNDAREEIQTAPEQYKQNLRYIINKLKNIGVEKIVLNAPPNFETIPGSWTQNSRKLIQSYADVLDKIADKKEVFIGDKQAWKTFTNNPKLLYDGLHPSQEGYKILGELWASAWKKAVL
ncbi:MAG: SGNH/GDSL hydrolase family protein [Bifidobacteriaceae bacterium]|jgi:lysophospholipase L1-like esterase|nr:SGNH/GDSL hydrolase family protein [Bifidobacteriaceae bacterium]